MAVIPFLRRVITCVSTDIDIKVIVHVHVCVAEMTD